MGSELRDRTLGVVGFGGIGRAVVELLAGFGMKPPLVFDPFVQPDAVIELGVTSVSLDELLARSRLRLDPLPAQRRDARPDRRARTRP